MAARLVEICGAHSQFLLITSAALQVLKKAACLAIHEVLFGVAIRCQSDLVGYEPQIILPCRLEMFKGTHKDQLYLQVLQT